MKICPECRKRMIVNAARERKILHDKRAFVLPPIEGDSLLSIWRKKKKEGLI